MKCTKTTAALLFSTAFCLIFASCGSDTTWAARAGGKTMPAGVYILSQISAYYDAQDKLAQTADASASSQSPSQQLKETLQSDVEGRTGSEFITDEAMQSAKRYFAAEKLFDELGLSFTQDDETILSQNLKLVWQYSQAFYEQNGVAQSSVEDVNRNYMKQNKVFSAVYGEGGEKELSDADYEAYWKETRARVRYMEFKRTDDTGMPLAQEEADKLKAKADAYLARAKAGEDIDKLAAEYRKETDPADESGEPTPGQNDAILTKDSTYPSKILTDEMFGAPLNEARLVEDASYYYVAMRVDPMFDRTGFENAKTSMLREMKQDEFNAWLAEQASGIEIEYNQASMKRYTPEKLKMETPQA